MVTRGVRRDGRQMNWKTGIDTYTLLYIKEITIKDLLGGLLNTL